MKYFASFSQYQNDKKNLKTHYHDYHEIVFFISGEGTTYIEDKPFPVKKGYMLVIPPKFRHGTIVKEKMSSLWIAEPGEKLLHLQSPFVIKNVDETISAIFNIIVNNRYNNQAFTNCLCQAITYYVLNNLEEKTEKDIAVDKIKSSISKNFDKSDFDVTKYLNESGYSEDYIRAYFKKVTGTTPIQFLTNIRIKHAMNLIKLYKNSYSLADVSEACGYEDYIYFSRKFKEITGISPQKYKKTLE